MIHIALYKPDIPQNTASIVRLAGCLSLKVNIIEPCGFNINDSRFKRVVMDYVKLTKIIRYQDFKHFENSNLKSRIILITTKAKKNYHQFKFKKNDILLFGRESAGVPIEIHKKILNKLKVPLSGKARSLNVAVTAAIVSAEAMRQNNYFK
jgi:tRNA (cytidine/uridine-2'-O-)-methyltransferase